LKWNKRKLLFGIIFSFKFNIINDDQPFANYETKEIQELFVIQDLLEHLVVILVPFNVKKRDWVLLADVLVQNHQDIRSVEDLAYYLASLFCVELFKNVQYFSNDLADSEDGFHILLGFEIIILSLKILAMILSPIMELILSLPIFSVTSMNYLVVWAVS